MHESRPRPRSAAPSGRHFLAPRVAAELVDALSIDPTDVVVEVGAGTGRITRALARRAGTVLAVERDPEVAARLLRSAGSWPNVFVWCGDALEVALPPGPFRVVGNIPFGITTSLLRRLFADPRATRLDLLVQWEVARKRAAGRGSVLSIVWAVSWSLRVEGRLPARVFHPVPAVDAAWLSAVRRNVPLVPARDLEAFERMVRRAFRRPHLPVERSLGVSRRTIHALGWGDPAGPAELDLEAWVALFRAI